jgi:hypothetical protein
MRRHPVAAEIGLAALAVLAAPLPGFAESAHRAEPGARIALDFVGSVARLRVMRAEVDAEVGAARYQGSVRFRSAGLVGFFKTARIEGRGEGARVATGFAPEAYEHVEVNGRKHREVRLAYEPEDVRVEATPPFGSPGDPAPTAAQRREALDPLSMILQVALAGGDEPCSRTVPVFDSKLRYDLEFQPDGVDDELRTIGYRGPAARCLVYYRPIAGYDPEDLAEDEVYATPIRIWLAEISPGVLAPALIYVRFSSSILPFSVKLELREATVAPISGADGG